MRRSPMTDYENILERELWLRTAQVFRLEAWTWETGWVAISKIPTCCTFLSTWEQPVWVSHYLLNLAVLDHIWTKCLHALLLRSPEGSSCHPTGFSCLHLLLRASNKPWAAQQRFRMLPACAWSTLQSCLTPQPCHAWCFWRLTDKTWSYHPHEKGWKV